MAGRGRGRGKGQGELRLLACTAGQALRRWQCWADALLVRLSVHWQLVRVLWVSVMRQDAMVVQGRGLTGLCNMCTWQRRAVQEMPVIELLGACRGTVLCAFCAMIKYICTSSEKGLFLVGFITVFLSCPEHCLSRSKWMADSFTGHAGSLSVMEAVLRAVPAT